MYQELQPLQEQLATELRENWPALVPTVEHPAQLLQAYIAQLTLYIGIDTGNESLTAVAVDNQGEIISALRDFASTPRGFRQFRTWVEQLRTQHQYRIVVVGSECTGIYYEEFWGYLHQHTSYARVLYNPRTTAHMGAVLSKRVRSDQVDAYLVAEQLRLGSTPEARPLIDEDLYAARLCSRSARDIAKEINRKKNQVRTLLRTFNPAFGRIFPGAKLWAAPAQTLLKQYIFPEDFIAAGTATLTTTLQAAGRGTLGQETAKALIAACENCHAHPGGRTIVRQRLQDLLTDIVRLKKRQKSYLKQGYQLIAARPETPLLRAVPGAGCSNTLALISEIGDAQRFPDGAHLASFLGLTTSKHLSGTTLHVSKHITKQGPRNARYAAVNLAGFLARYVPRYQDMYQRIKHRQPPRKGHYVALVAIARDFVTTILYDLLTQHRPFFREVADYRQYCQQQQ